ncbi:MAG: ROK family protein [Opitutales bacterium]|nr:ROK family protein [Opitutales bacterium]
MAKKYAIGIDIGGTNTKLGVVAADAQVLFRDRFNTPDYKTFDSYVKMLAMRIRGLMEQSEGECVGIGIGAPNGNYYKGTIDNAPNLPFGAGEFPLVANLREEFGLKHIYMTNDANAAALGEKIYGGAKDLEHFITITLGTGLGSGIIIDGKLLYGADGAAGELGHTCAIPNGRLCNCGNRGCLETYASATGIKRTFFELMAEYNGNSLLKDKSWDEIDAFEIEKAAKAGDKIARETYRKTGEILGKSLADFVAFSRPQSIFLFGGPVKSGELLLAPARKALDENLYPIWRGKIKIVPSHLPESDAAIMGSSSLVWAELAEI